MKSSLRFETFFEDRNYLSRNKEKYSLESVSCGESLSSYVKTFSHFRKKNRLNFTIIDFAHNKIKYVFVPLDSWSAGAF